jgi:uncharacterized membrane protein
MLWPFPSPRIDHERVVAALASAEAGTSGEIRVIIARHAAKDPVAAAQGYFDSLGMAGSAHRNGILLFVAPPSRTFAVIGDRAVHEVCGDAFWTALSTAMRDRFRAGDFTGALVHGIEEAGRLLGRAFPRGPGDGPVPPPTADEVD